MKDLLLFRIRAVRAGQAVNLLTAMSSGGLRCIVSNWLQGNLAATARLLLRGHSAVGRRLHAGR